MRCSRDKGFEKHLPIHGTRSPHACPGLEACSEKTREGSKISRLADLQALSKQEMKAEAVVNCLAEYLKVRPNIHTGSSAKTFMAVVSGI